MNHFFPQMFGLSKMSDCESRSISAENFTGEKGKGGMSTDGARKERSGALGQGWKVSPCIHIQPGETFELANISGSGAIKHIWMTECCPKNRKLILRMYWDGSDIPSVEVPAGDFFACADPQNYAPLSSLAVCVNPRRGFNCYWDMPFYTNCRITLENIYYEEIVVYYQIDYILAQLEPGYGYFHAQYRQELPTAYKTPYTILDNVKGKGQYVGTYILWSPNRNGWWGEGEIKFYLDGDKDFPTICGTGTEDYFCGSHNFDPGDRYQEFCTPYAGLAKVTLASDRYHPRTSFSMYRWHICDPIYFKEDLKITIQALGYGQKNYIPLRENISSVAYWYQDSICSTFPPLPTPEELDLDPLYS